MDYDYFTIDVAGSVKTRTFFKNGQIVGVERTVETYREHPYDISITDPRATVLRPPPEDFDPYGIKKDSEWPDIID